MMNKTGKKQYPSILAHPIVFLSWISLMCCEIGSTSTLFTWIGFTVSLPRGKKNPNFPGLSHHTWASPSITILSRLIELQILSKWLSPFPFSLSLCFWLLSFSPSLRVSWNTGRRARRAWLCVGGLSASFLFKQEPTQRPHFPAKFKPEAMLTVWCYRPLCKYFCWKSGLDLSWQLPHHTVCSITVHLRQPLWQCISYTHP